MKILAALLAVLGAVPCANSVAAELHGGWAVWVPYQYEKASPGGLKTLSGLDIEVMRAASDIAGLDVSFEQTPWSENLRAVADGKLDFALGATRETSREVYARFSRPYRKESIYLFTRSGDGRKWRAASPIESLKGIRERGGKLAVEAGYYYGPEVAAILAEPTDRQWVIRVPDPSAALSALISGEADAMLSDRVAGPSVAWDARSLNKIEELSGPLYETDLCFAFSKKTVSPEMVASYDRALDSLKSSGELERMTRHYLVPRLLMITLGTTWFSALEIIGIVAFAISGVIIARRENYDIIGAAVLAFLPALGGGV
ncbi:MAG: transporter substrate-binding domain-containing protein, partial [Chthoniobacterales bacterium]